MEAVGLEGVEALAEDQLRAAASDVRDQARLEVVGERVRDPEVDEPRLLPPRDDLDRVSERRLRLGQEVLGVPRPAKRVRTDGADPGGRDVPDPLPEPPEGVERPLGGLRGEPALVVEAPGHLHGLPDPVDDGRLPVHDPRQHHVERVRTQVHGGEVGSLIGGGRVLHGRIVAATDPVLAKGPGTGTIPGCRQGCRPAKGGRFGGSSGTHSPR